MAPPEPKRVAILGFHKIGEPAPDGWATWFYIPEQTFRRQLAALGNQGWRVIDLNTFVEGLAAPSCLPDRAALLTFDDGHRSLREVALPCLRDFGHPAVLFIPTDYIGKRSEFDPDEPIEDITGRSQRWIQASRTPSSGDPRQSSRPGSTNQSTRLRFPMATTGAIQVR
jgi:hypothetical protein